MNGALRRPAFRRLTVAWTFSNAGDSALYLTAPIWAKDLTGSNASAGLVFLALGLPVVLAPFAGHLADRMSRRLLVVVVNLVAALGVLSLLAVDSAADIWLVYAVIFGYGCVGYVTSAAQSGLLRDLLDDDELAGANGLLSSIDQGLRLLTPLAGAGLYAWFGGGAVALLTAGLLLVAALVLVTMKVQETPPVGRGERAGFGRELTAGARHVRSVPVLGQVIVVVGVAFALTGLANSTTFAVIDDGLRMSTEFFGVLASIQGCGAVVAGVTAGRLVRRIGERAAVGVGLTCLAVGIAGGLSTSVVLVAAGTVVVGLGVVWMVVGLVTLRQRLTPPRLQGRVSAATNLALNGPQVVGTATGAALIASVDYRVLIAVMTVTILACAAVLLVRGAAEAPRTPSAAPSLAPNTDDDRFTGIVQS
ncbi:MFS transporter [Jiangella asiatica]|uniref:MFS transporter n=1 Tax=Jiangella asiatica TaxID=2530372 RepID=A0A4R5DPK2_9ACTN|nr:MFS transporter [Jiangella asiatica]TDE14124.1 MFS transporter [Jiangella asiatica]